MRSTSDWGRIDAKGDVAVNMRCDACGAGYIIHCFSMGRIGDKILSINEGCSCGHSYGEVIGLVEDEWPDVIGDKE